MSMVDPQGGVEGNLGAPTTYLEHIDGAPLGGGDGGTGAPTTYLEDINGGSPWRQ
jgi:hypothetical protein